MVLTCDCGTSAHDAIAALTASGIDVIVSDHHLPSRPVPDCLAVLNPRQPACDYPDKDLDLVGSPDPLIVGPPSGIYETGEHTGRLYPIL